jgi:hypothetical protein
MPGLRDHDVIDLVTRDPRTDEFALVMVQTDPWTESADQQANDLREKIATYVAFARRGLTEHFPEAAGKPFYIQLDCQTPPPPAITELLALAGKRLEQNGISSLSSCCPEARTTEIPFSRAVVRVRERTPESCRQPRPADPPSPPQSGAVLTRRS